MVDLVIVAFLFVSLTNVLSHVTAFAELQTDMKEIECDRTGNMPFLSYKDFSMKMLFPNTPADEHPVIKGFEVSVGDDDIGINTVKALKYLWDFCNFKVDNK